MIIIQRLRTALEGHSIFGRDLFRLDQLESSTVKSQMSFLHLWNKKVYRTFIESSEATILFYDWHQSNLFLIGRYRAASLARNWCKPWQKELNSKILMQEAFKSFRQNYSGKKTWSKCMHRFTSIRNETCRATKDLSSGTISNAWHFVAEDMEATADTHRSIAATLSDELVRPLKSFVESQHKSRKSVESIVDKR